MLKKLTSLLLVSMMLLWGIPKAQAQTGGGASPRWKAPRQVFSDMEALTSDCSVRAVEDTHTVWLFNADTGMWELVGGGAGLNWLDPVKNTYDPTPGLPVGPAIGDRYLSLATANGWTKDNVYEWDGAIWVENVAVTNDAVYNETSAATSIYDGTEWRTFGTATSFVALNDTPFSYVGQAYKLIKVTGPADAVEYTILRETANGDLIIGNGLAGYDYTVTVDGATNDLVITWLDATAVMQIDATVSMNAHQIKNLLDPTDDQDAATKYYVDAVTAGLLWLEPVIDFFDPTAGLPVGPTAGDRYLSTATANGWTIDRIYEWSGAIWTETVPVHGNAVYNNADSKAYLYYVTGGVGSWILFGSIMKHNALSGLQGGAIVHGADEYYHTSQEEYQVLRDNQPFDDNRVIITDATAFASGKLNTADALQWIRADNRLVIGEDVTAGTPNVAGTMRLISAGDNAWMTTLTAGTQTADADYTLPTAMSTIDGQVMASTTAGVMSWVSPTLQYTTDFGSITTNQLSLRNALAADLGQDVTAGSPNIAGSLQLWSAGDNDYSTTFTAATQTGTTAYTLPVNYPAVNDYALTSSTAGVMSWQSVPSLEADTLATVTARGATTATASTFSGGLTASDATTALTIGAGGAATDYRILFDGNTQDGEITYIDATDTFDMSCSLSLNAGQAINEFSIDGTLAGNSDTALPTEKAVKTYVDNSVPPPGGADSNVQYNNSGAFGGEANFTWDDTAKNLMVAGSATPLTIGDGSAVDYVLTFDADNADGSWKWDEDPGVWDAGAVRITNVADPTANQDVATKNYVDGAVPGALWTRVGTDLSPNTSGDTVTADGGLTIGIAAAGVDYALTFDGEDNDGTLTYMEDEDRFDFDNDVNIGNDLNVLNNLDVTGTSQLDGNVTIGDGSAGVDYTLTFNGEDNDGVITWMEDEDLFDMSCSLRLNAGQAINEFSTDGTLGDNLDTALVSEKAIKTYVDNSVTPPGGNDTYVQYNNAGAFGGDAGFVYDATNDSVTITDGTYTVDIVDDATPSAGKFTDGTRTVTLADGNDDAGIVVTDGTDTLQLVGANAVVYTPGTDDVLGMMSDDYGLLIDVATVNVAPAYLLWTVAAGDTALAPLRLGRDTTGTPASGIGTGIEFYVQDDTASDNQGQIKLVLDTVASGTVDARMDFYHNIAGAMTRALSLNEDGVLVHDAYTLPKVDGAADQVLQTSGAGIVSWASFPAEADTLATVTGRGATTAKTSEFQNALAVVLGADAATNTAGQIKLWSAGANNFYTTFTAAEQTANATYTLPVAMPASNKFLQSTDAGVLSWETGTGYTNLTSFVDQTAWRVFYSNADGDVTELALGTDGQVLTSSGVDSAPAFEDATGGAVGKWTVVTKTDTYSVLTGDVAKTLVMNSADDKVFNLPSVDSGDIGTWYTFVKIGAGKVTIDAADSDKIADSGAGDTIYNDQASETYATLILQLVSETQWVITGMDGTWTVTD